MAELAISLGNREIDIERVLGQVHEPCHPTNYGQTGTCDLAAFVAKKGEYLVSFGWFVGANPETGQRACKG